MGLEPSTPFFMDENCPMGVNRSTVVQSHSGSTLFPFPLMGGSLFP